MLKNNAALKSKIDELWKKFWAGGKNYHSSFLPPPPKLLTLAQQIIK